MSKTVGVSRALMPLVFVLGIYIGGLGAALAKVSMLCKRLIAGLERGEFGSSVLSAMGDV